MDECDNGTGSAALQEALFEQQRLLQQLYSELDVEREASSSAASEALSMILRLQGEKASLKMEASQYKRMAEEKMCHAEEALDVFEDLIYQREMEIASLEFQVQAYRYRLVSMGYNDLGVYENKFPENLLMQRHDTSSGENGPTTTIRRLKSLPQICTKDSNLKKGTAEKRRSGVDSIPRFMDESAGFEANDSEKKAGSSDINSYWEQIKKLDERVKEISEAKDPGKTGPPLLKGGTWSPSLFSLVSIGLPANSDQVKPQENSMEKLEVVNSSCSSGVQDIFEVPQSTGSHKALESRKKERRRLLLEGENRLEKPDSVSEESLESNKGKTNCVKTLPLPSCNEKKLPKLRDGVNVERNVLPRAEYEQLCWRIGQLERARDNFRQEITAEGQLELNLLKGIHDQLQKIQAEMKSWKTKKSWLPDEPSLDPLHEAMLYFWF